MVIYKVVMVEAVPHFHLTHKQLEARAEDIISLITELRPQLGLAEALTATWDRYVDGEPQVDLRRFSELIADARRQAMIQRQLDDDRMRLHSGELDHEHRVEVGHHYETLRREACIYNHLLRGVIEQYGEHFSRDELTDWLTRASQGVHPWAIGEITGAVSEVLLHAALMGLPELIDLRYGTVEEDLHGYDFVGFWQGKMVTMDAKTGLYRPLTERKHGHRHLEISVPRNAAKEFHITRHGLDTLRHEARQALHAGFTPLIHASHQFYN